MNVQFGIASGAAEGPCESDEVQPGASGVKAAANRRAHGRGQDAGRLSLGVAAVTLVTSNS